MTALGIKIMGNSILIP